MKGLFEFLDKSRAEFKKVEWPTKKETIRLTAYVIGVSFGVGLIVLGMDYAFKEGMAFLISLK
ncbi:preprotein translocase subunit SecE [Patescibacteria group bacterium]|nr:preprotein translocase subunit SecE [Patescibacteria group bacterium]HOM78125.1 preprotein translocase subunit SecE [bacterium]